MQELFYLALFKYISCILIIDAAVSSTDFLVTSIDGHLYFWKVFFASKISFLIFSMLVYFVFSVSLKEFILFFLKSTSRSGSVFKPTTQVIWGFSLNFLGKEFSLTKGIFEVLNPLFAR